jgi:hypothetical protein
MTVSHFFTDKFSRGERISARCKMNCKPIRTLAFLKYSKPTMFSLKRRTERTIVYILSVWTLFSCFNVFCFYCVQSMFDKRGPFIGFVMSKDIRRKNRILRSETFSLSKDLMFLLWGIILCNVHSVCFCLVLSTNNICTWQIFNTSSRYSYFLQVKQRKAFKLKFKKHQRLFTKALQYLKWRRWP